MTEIIKLYSGLVQRILVFLMGSTARNLDLREVELNYGESNRNTSISTRFTSQPQSKYSLEIPGTKFDNQDKIYAGRGY